MMTKMAVNMIAASVDVSSPICLTMLINCRGSLLQYLSSRKVHWCRMPWMPSSVQRSFKLFAKISCKILKVLILSMMAKQRVHHSGDNFSNCTRALTVNIICLGTSPDVDVIYFTSTIPIHNTHFKPLYTHHDVVWEYINTKLLYI